MRAHPLLDLLRVEIAQHDHQPQPPGRHLALEPQALHAASSAAVMSRSLRSSSARRGCNAVLQAQLLETSQRELDARLVEQQHELVAQPRRREVADEVHLAAGPRQGQRVAVHAKAVAVLVAHRPEDARRVFDEAQVVEHHDAPARAGRRGRRSSRAAPPKSRGLSDTAMALIEKSRRARSPRMVACSTLGSAAGKS